MRGPGMRLELDMRRTWTCPACGNAQKLGWQATSLRCPCQPGGVLMTLTQDVRPRRTFVIPEFVPIPDPADLPEPATPPIAPPAMESASPVEVAAEVTTTKVAMTEVTTTEVISIEVETTEVAPPPVLDSKPNEIDWPEEA